MSLSFLENTMNDPDNGYMSQDDFDEADRRVCEDEIGMSVEEADARTDWLSSQDGDSW